MSHHLVGMAEIAEILGVSRQRVAQLIEIYDDFPSPEVDLSGGRVWSRTAVETWILAHPERGSTESDPDVKQRRRRSASRQSGGAMFDRFTDRARHSIVKAQEEARLLNHNYIGTEHLVLGLIALEDGIAYKVLDSLGVTLTSVREQVVELIGRGSSLPEGPIPFTPRTKKVLEIALREALQLGHNYVGTEHVLLGVIREHEGVGWRALENLGLNRKEARTAVLTALQGFRPSGLLSRLPGVATGKISVRKSSREPGVSCSFCGKAQADCEKLIAGPGDVYICDECVALCGEIISESGVADPPDKTTVDVDARLAALEGAVAELSEKLVNELRKRNDDEN